MKCRLCGKTPHQHKGWLERVNEKGVPGIWECRPSCDADLPRELRIVGAIEGMTKDEKEREEYYNRGGLHPCYD
jgi:hypothetical protein